MYDWQRDTIVSEIFGMLKTVAGDIQQGQLAYQDLIRLIRNQTHYSNRGLNFQEELFCRFSSDYQYIYANDLCRHCFFQNDDMTGKNVLESIPLAYHATIKKIFATLDQNHPNISYEYKYIGNDGQSRWRHWTLRAVFNNNRQLAEYQVLIRDITEQKQVEDQLRHRTIVEQAIIDCYRLLIGVEEPDFNLLLKLLGEAISANRAFIFELHEDGTTVSITYEWCDSNTEPRIGFWQNIQADSFLWMTPIILRNIPLVVPEFKLFPSHIFNANSLPQLKEVCSVALMPIMDSRLNLYGVLGFDNIVKSRPWLEEDIGWLKIFADMLGTYWERERYEKALRSTEARLHDHLLTLALQKGEENMRKLAELCPVFIAVYQDGRIRYVNSAVQNLSGYSKEEFMSIDPVLLFHPDFQKLFQDNARKRLQGEYIPPYEVRFQSKDGKDIWGYLTADTIEYEGRPAIIGAMADITHYKKNEEEWQSMSRLESLGVLAGGIAHDFNNILTVISGNISLAKMLVDMNSDVYEILDEVEKASQQARDLTQQLLTFSQGGAPIKETASIQELIRDSVSFVLRGSNVSCDLQMDEDLWPVEIDRGQISQVINNMIINADQAMPEGGIINLTVKNVYIDEDNVNYLKPGKYIRISIRDQGVGIPEKYLRKIFDPYFSTKQKGHGLGLAMAYSIIRRHEGHIEVTSTLGEGTTFNISLPATDKVPVVHQEEDTGNIHLGGRILVMDDDEMIRNMLGRMLIQMGCDVAYASDGEEALALYKESMGTDKPFNAVIVDLTIPGGVGGKKALACLKEIDPEVKAIVSSGYSNDPIMADYKSHGFKGVIPKPYKIATLREVLRTVL
jgi:PAS domain S-box-containing protein